MVDQITCPHCKGSGVNYVIIAKDDKPSIESVNCAVCKGSGNVAIPEEPAGPVNVVQEAELWPILVPLGIFSLFFIFLLI
jgi:transcription elongation factor Elf1